MVAAEKEPQANEADDAAQAKTRLDELHPQCQAAHQQQYGGYGPLREHLHEPLSPVPRGLGHRVVRDAELLQKRRQRIDLAIGDVQVECFLGAES